MILSQQFRRFSSEIPWVSDKEIALFDFHYQVLKKWSDKVSLVSKGTLESPFGPHYIDSLYIVDFAIRFGGKNFFDVGSGGGFPGLIFAIRFPKEKITVYESQADKRGFLNAAKTELGLKNVEVDAAMPPKLPKGVVMARAVFPIDELLEKFSTHLEKGSTLIANLGGEKELKTSPGFSLAKEIEYTLPDGAGKRRCLGFTWNG